MSAEHDCDLCGYGCDLTANHDVDAIRLEVLQGLLTDLRVWPDGDGRLRVTRGGPFLEFDAYEPGQPGGDGWKLYTTE